ncbi:MAG: thioredoxin family protein [Lewinellaceae bacterium]|nr:thioredoxin family protein [Lewinellaceae bacterium]
MQKAKIFLPLLVLILAMAFRLADNNGYHVGDKAADFTLKNVDGESMRLADIKEAKGYMVIFTCNSCPYAKAYEGRIMDLDQKYASKGVSVVAINSNDVTIKPDDSFEKMQDRAKEKQYSFPYLYDESQEVAKTYGATRTPHVYLLDANRVVRYIGAIDDNSEEPSEVKEKYLENAVDAMLEGRDIAVKETKAVGCGIKWKKG